ncbi:MAG: VTT domain-containing protein [Polyangia bacterium]
MKVDSQPQGVVAREETGHGGDCCWRIGEVERLAFLIDGESYFSALAAALPRARRSILLAGWDIDSRIVLKQGSDRGESPSLGEFLRRAVEREPGLEVHILVWDFSVIYTFEREPLPRLKLGWGSHGRIHFHMDDEHPIGGSHHQKLVVIDDALAFTGGFDLTHERWDTQRHAADDPRRADRDGRRYLPFHDVQVVVGGKAASDLGDLFRSRWLRATGERLSARRPAQADPWPTELEPDLTDSEVCIARTEPEFKGRPEVRELERLHLETIASARESLYIENQYLTSASICEALERSLRASEGPQVLIVLPLRSGGWLEERTMNILRIHRLACLRRADSHGRLRVCYPKVPGLEDGWVNLHSKLLVADERVAIVGTANLSNRSMGLDTECAVALRADRFPRAAAAIARLRDRLLAEHLGTEPQAVAAELRERGGLFEAVDALSGGPRTLAPIEDGGEDELPEPLREGLELVDPERPAALDVLIDHLGLDERVEPKRRRLAALASLTLIAAALALVWQLTPLRELLDPGRLAELAEQLRGSTAGWLISIGAFAVAGPLVFPVTPLFAAVGSIYDPAAALAISTAGCALDATVTYWLGRWLGRERLRRISGPRIARIDRELARRGLVAMALVRLVPTAPFSIINMAVGASRVGFRDYLLGTMLGMMPGIVAVTLLARSVVDMIIDPGPLSAGLFVLGAIAIAAVALWMRRRLARRS